MKIFTIDEILEEAREKVPFYKSSFEKSFSDWKSTRELSVLPVLDQTLFWKMAKAKMSNVLSEDPSGIVFKSGGTTGSPKFSFFTNEEWATFTQEFGWGMEQNAVEAGDRIANLFYAGDLYASFLFIFSSLHYSKLKHLQLPIAGSTDTDKIYESLVHFGANVICGVPTTLVNLAEKFLLEGKKIKLTKILYGGEALLQDQEDLLRQVFGDARMQSIGYASVDGGLLGFASKSSNQRIHHVFTRSTIMELVDEDTLEPIVDCGRVGKLLLTSLTRKLMPIIRYPVGDRVRWVNDDKEFRAFEIVGRSEEGARIGPVTLYYDDVIEICRTVLRGRAKILGLQLESSTWGRKDNLLIKLAVDTSKDLNSSEIMDQLLHDRAELGEALKKNLINCPELIFCHVSELQTNSRTGKMLRVIDRRYIETSSPLSNNPA